MLTVAVIGGVASLAMGSTRSLEAVPGETILREDLIFVTDDNNRVGFSGCDEIRVVDARTGAGVDQSHYRMSPGRLTVTSDARLVLATRINGEGEWARVMVRYPGERPKWASRDVPIGAGLWSPIGLSPDDETMLVAMGRHEVEKHRVADISLTSLGPAMGGFPVQAAEIVFSPDSRTAYLIDLDGAVHVVDVATMRAIGASIPYTPVRIAKHLRVSNTFASISPDGRYLVINSRGPEVNVVDLLQRRSVLVSAPGVDTTYDLEFNYAAPAENLLAVHGRRAVAVYRLHGMDSLESLARLAVPGQTDSSGAPVEWKRLDTLAWTGSGDGVIVAITGTKEYRILDWELGPPASLRPRLDFDACTVPNEYLSAQQSQYDVVTVNKPSGPVTPTPTASPCPTMTPEPVITTPTAAPTLAPTNTPTGTPSAPPTPTVTPRPGPIYLPLSLREQCIPGQQRVDVALVIDASSSMEDPTSTGRRKLNAALAAVTQFLANLALPSDQAAIVVFNSDAWLRQELAGDRGLITSALQGIQTAKQTRLDRGVAVGHEELVSSRRRPGNQAVMIVLTDGLANPVPASVAVEEAAAAKADQITIFTIGLGNELDEWALQAMASRPDYYYWAPDAEDLTGIYRRIAVTIPCPAGQFWGRR